MPDLDRDDAFRETGRSLPVVVYTPESPLRQPVRLLRSLFTGFRNSRELAWRLLVRNLSAQYRQTMLGYLWVLLPALATTALWVFLNGQKIVHFDSPGVPYPAFVLVGMLLWQVFLESLNAPLSKVSEAKPMLAKINFPREALLLVALGEVVVNFLVRLALLVGVFAWFRLPVPPTILLAPLGVLALIALGMALGTLMVPLGSLYGDVGRAVAVLSGFWMFLTPVIYPPPQTWPASLINWLNPVSPLLLTTRDWMLTGTTPHLVAFGTVVAATLAAGTAALLLYRLSMPILIERMNA